MSRHRAPLLLWALVSATACQRHFVHADADTGAEPSDSGGDGGDSVPPDPCGITHDLGAEPFVEGDTIQFRIWCSETEAKTQELSLTGAPENLQFDPTTGNATWLTDGRDAGQRDLIVAALGVSGMPETIVLPLRVVDNPEAANATGPDPATYFEEWGLPVMHVTMMGEPTTTDKAAQFTVRGEQVWGEIKKRGATSLAYPKNSFTLDFDEELGVDEWEGSTRGHMVLTSTFDDNSYVRQKLVYDLWRAMADAQGEHRLTPRTFFTVLYINGEYVGLYLGSDRIDDEFIRHMDMSGDGNLYKSVTHDANFRLTDEFGETKTDLTLGYEKKEGDDADWSDLESLIEFTGTADGVDVLSDGRNYLDRDEFTDWLLLATYALTEDSVGKNAYFYSDAPGEPFRYIPWDFNQSWGQAWQTKRKDVDRIPDYTEANRVFEIIESNPALTNELKRRYRALRRPGQPFDPAWLQERLDAYYALIGPSAARDWDRWGEDYSTFFRWAEIRDDHDDWTDYEGERAYLEGWVAARAGHMDAWAE
jgi:spore coat protein H